MYHRLLVLVLVCSVLRLCNHKIYINIGEISTTKIILIYTVFLKRILTL